MEYLRWLAILILIPDLTSVAEEQIFDVKLVVEGVYAAIPKPGHMGNCNAAIVLLDDGVLVVDTHAKPSAARALIAEIKQLTDKPVKYVVNTHFHSDHYQGNQVYPNAWPGGVEIISSEATRQSLQLRGIPRVKHELITVAQNIEKLKADLAKTTEAKQKMRMQENLDQAEDYLAELKRMQVTLPSITFDRSLILYRASRTVEILWLGKGHTDGDVVVYLPKEKVIATGDLVMNGCLPNMADSYPYDWIKTLDAVEKLDFDYGIGGHGDVMRGKGQFKRWKQYLSEVMAKTAEAYAQGLTLDEARKRIAATLQPKYADMSKCYPESWPQDLLGNVEKAYRVVSGMTE